MKVYSLTESKKQLEIWQQKNVLKGKFYFVFYNNKVASGGYNILEYVIHFCQT